MPKLRRPRAASRRRRRVAVKYNDDELTTVQSAAARESLGVAAYLGRAGIDAAAGTAIPASRVQLDTLKSFQDATEQVRMAGRLFNQAVARLNATGNAGPEFRRYADNLARTVRVLENVSIDAAKKIL